MPVPIVTTQAVTAISGTTATGNGNITDLGYPNPTQHGHCWNTTGAPTTADSKTQNGAASATGAFTSAMTGLATKTLYYVRAYATNAAGTDYGNEKFSTYTEVDPGSHITVTADKVEWASLPRNIDAYVYDDKGVDYFNGNFTHNITFLISAQQAYNQGYLWALTNILDDWTGIDTAGGDGLAIGFGRGGAGASFISVDELDGGGLYRSADTFGLTLSTEYYAKVVRDESVGTYGTLYLYIYSDAARTNLLQTLSLALHSSKKDYRYIHAVLSENAGAGWTYTCSGYSKDFNLDEVTFTTLFVPKIFII